MRICILGTGSSAVAAAWGIAAAIEGRSVMGNSVTVTVIDYTGIESADDNQSARSLNPTGKVSGVDLFSIPRQFKIDSTLSGEFAGSAAYGGLANGWGATLLPYPPDYIALWGSAAEDMRWSLTAVEMKLPSLGAKLDRGGRYGPDRVASGMIPIPKSGEMPPSITRRNSIAEASRLAIRPLSNDPLLGCIQCGRCLEGCSWGHIWTPKQAWEKVFREHSEFMHMNGEWVESLSKNETGIGVTSMSKSGEKITREFDKVFVALGPIQTAALMIRSKLTNRECVSIRDSQMIVLPVVLPGLRRTGSGELTRISLSDVFAYSNNQSERPGFDWFAQLYGASTDLNDTILAKVSLLRMVPKFFRDWTFARLGFAMVFLPGSGSGSIEVSEGNDGKIRVLAKSNKRLGWRLRNVRFGLRELGYYPLPIVRRKIPVGLGYHFGASFPIAKEFKEIGDDLSDELGTINGVDGIHLVDASVLPAISSRPITLTTMANAFRIARTAVVRNGGHYQ